MQLSGAAKAKNILKPHQVYTNGCYLEILLDPLEFQPLDSRVGRDQSARNDELRAVLFLGLLRASRLKQYCSMACASVIGSGLGSSGSKA